MKKINNLITEIVVVLLILTTCVLAEATYTPAMTEVDIASNYEAKLKEATDNTTNSVELDNKLIAIQEDLHILAEELRVSNASEEILSLLQALWQDANNERIILKNINYLETSEAIISNTSDVGMLKGVLEHLHIVANSLREKDAIAYEKEIKIASTLWQKAHTAINTKKHRYSNIAKNITKEEIDILAKIVHIEAGGESNAGQQAIVECIFNRVNSSRFPNTIHDVLYAKNQFTSVKYLNKIKAKQKEYNNVQAVLDGKTKNVSDKTVFFNTTPINNNIDKRIGNHVFSKIK